MKILATSVAKTDAENAAIITYILMQYISGKSLECSHRTQDYWLPVVDLPTNFSDYKYRIENEH